jgi:hypothetical protein
MSKNFHEHYDLPEEALPSDRSIGFLFAAVAVIIAYVRRHEPAVAYSALGVAGILVGVSLIRPIALRPLNIVWMKIAQLMNRIVSPIIMGLLFVVVIVPAGFIMQMFRDPLRKRRKGSEASYWIEYEKRQTPPSMINQF